MEKLTSLLGWIFSLLFFIALILRGQIRFDLNQYLNLRQERKVRRIRNKCPHTMPIEEQGKLVIRSTFFRPPGTLSYRCQMCGQVTDDENMIKEIKRRWAINLIELINRLEELAKMKNKL